MAKEYSMWRKFTESKVNKTPKKHILLTSGPSSDVL